MEEEFSSCYIIHNMTPNIIVDYHYYLLIIELFNVLLTQMMLKSLLPWEPTTSDPVNEALLNLSL